MLYTELGLFAFIVISARFLYYVSATHFCMNLSQLPTFTLLTSRHQYSSSTIGTLSLYSLQRSNIFKFGSFKTWLTMFWWDILCHNLASVSISKIFMRLVFMLISINYFSLFRSFFVLSFFRNVAMKLMCEVDVKGALFRSPAAIRWRESGAYIKINMFLNVLS